MTALILLSLFVGAADAEPPKYDPEPGLRDLLSDASGGMGDVDRLLGTPLEKEQNQALKMLIEDLGSKVKGAADAAQTLDANAQACDDHMTDRVRGRNGQRSFDELYDEASAADAALRKRRQQDAASAKTLKNAAPPPKLSADELSRRKDDIEKLTDLLAQADGSLGSLEDALKSMDEARGDAKQKRSIGAEDKYELHTAAEGEGKAAAAMSQAAPEARSRIDTLGTEPVEENHTQAVSKLQPVLEAGRAAARGADTAKNRARDFSSRYAAFVKSAARFDEARKTAKSKMDDAGGTLSSAEDLLSRLKNQ